MPAEVKLISCRLCGVIMVKLSRDVCQKCLQTEEQFFIKVRDHLRACPGCSIDDVVIATGVSKAHVQHFISSGRLERIGAEIAHPCQTCHKTIKTGLICSECSRDLKEQVSSLKASVARFDSSPDSQEDKKHRKGDDGGFHVGKPRK